MSSLVVSNSASRSFGDGLTTWTQVLENETTLVVDFQITPALQAKCAKKALWGQPQDALPTFRAAGYKISLLSVEIANNGGEFYTLLIQSHKAKKVETRFGRYGIPVVLGIFPEKLERYSLTALKSYKGTTGFPSLTGPLSEDNTEAFSALENNLREKVETSPLLYLQLNGYLSAPGLEVFRWLENALQYAHFRRFTTLKMNFPYDPESSGYKEWIKGIAYSYVFQGAKKTPYYILSPKEWIGLFNEPVPYHGNQIQEKRTEKIAARLAAKELKEMAQGTGVTTPEVLAPAGQIPDDLF